MTQDAANRVDASGFPASDVLPSLGCAAMSRMCLAVPDVYVMNPYALVYCAPEAPGGTKGTANSVMETPRDKRPSMGGTRPPRRMSDPRTGRNALRRLLRLGVRRGSRLARMGRCRLARVGREEGTSQARGRVTSAPRRCEIPQAGLVLWK